MTRRYEGPMSGERYLANANPSQREVHDLDNEKVGCQINDIVRAGHARPYLTVEAAKRDGFDNCYWCLGNSKR